MISNETQQTRWLPGPTVGQREGMGVLLAGKTRYQAQLCI